MTRRPFSIVLASAVLIAACGGSGGASPSTGGSPSAAASATASPVPTFDVSITVMDFEFNPSGFEVASGTNLGLLAQGAQSEHTFTIDALDIDEEFEPGIAVVTITGEPGQYDFYCRYHKDRGMVGTVTITE